MTDVSAEFHRRWRSGRHFGAHRPRAKVMVRLGQFHHDYFGWGDDKPTVNATITGEGPRLPWRAKWTPEGDWIEVPNVTSINLDQTFDQEGTVTGTVALDNILYTEAEGNLGLMYHLIERGALAPYRGYKAPGATFDVPDKDEDWYGVLREDAQIKIWQGYGLDEMEPVLMGFIDKVTTKAKPAQITLTFRCTGGKLLSDNHIFKLNKSKQLTEPVIFKQDDRRGIRVGFDASASSTKGGNLARFVLDDSPSTEWQSADRESPTNTEWVQVKLKKGKYTGFSVEPGYAGMEMWVGVKATARLGEQHGGAEMQPPQFDGEDIATGWVDGGSGDTVPGDVDGGWHFVKHWDTVAKDHRVYNFPGVLSVGDGSILRVGFRKLSKRPDGDYRASVVRLKGIKAKKPPVNHGGNKNHVILVEDPSDIVRVVLRWAGFTTWHVEDTGVRLEGEWVFARDSTYMDAINKVKEASGYIFFMADPDDGSGMGVPVFRQSRFLNPPSGGMTTIRDTDLLSEIEVNLSDETKSYFIRVRGRYDKQGERLGAQTAPAIQDNYKPPWSKSERIARIRRRHFVYTNPKLKTLLACKVLSRLVAVQQAMAGALAEIEIPGTPEFDLDDQIRLRDAQTGVASRLLVTGRTSEYQTGRTGTWVTHLNGSLLDHIDVVESREDLREVLAGDNAKIALAYAQE